MKKHKPYRNVVEKEACTVMIGSWLDGEKRKITSIGEEKRPAQTCKKRMPELDTQSKSFKAGGTVRSCHT